MIWAYIYIHTTSLANRINRTYVGDDDLSNGNDEYNEVDADPTEWESPVSVNNGADTPRKDPRRTYSSWSGTKRARYVMPAMLRVEVLHSVADIFDCDIGSKKPDLSCLEILSMTRCWPLSFRRM